MEALNVLRVTIEGPATSFRYPHFAQGVHPTFELPPPATVYGLLCSTWGDRLAQEETLGFGYTFTHRGKFEDFEHLHFEGTMNPFRRYLLFEPRLTLYIAYPDMQGLAAAFRSPHYALALGRSQDLMACTAIETVTLEQVKAAYFEGALLPPNFAPYLDGSTITVTMARYIDERRQPTWGQYALLRGRGRFPTEAISIDSPYEWVWADRNVHEWSQYPDLPRGVWLHRFVEKTAHAAT